MFYLYIGKPIEQTLKTVLDTVMATNDPTLIKYAQQFAMAIKVGEIPK